tara:strand:- start:129 stop:335 length:207 start_codon:yes stop_codon:yes gene_type:complete
MSRELTVVKKDAYYRIKEDFGILKKGMRCYCYAHDLYNIVLFFETPLIGDIQEVKLSKKSAYILEKIN